MTRIATEQLTRAHWGGFRTRGLLVWLDRDGLCSQYATHDVDTPASVRFVRFGCKRYTPQRPGCWARVSRRFRTHLDTVPSRRCFSPGTVFTVHESLSAGGDADA